MIDVDINLQDNTFLSNQPNKSKSRARHMPSHVITKKPITTSSQVTTSKISTTMEANSIELKIISCKDLKNFNFFQKLTIYTLSYLHSINPKRKLDAKQAQQQKTHTDKEGDENPEWNQEMKFSLTWVSSLHDCDDLFLHFEFRHDGAIIGDKLIGEVRVPLKDLIFEAGDTPNVVRFVNYEVRNSEGKPNGIFNFSYKVSIHKKGSSENRVSSENFEGCRISGYPILDPNIMNPYPPNNSSSEIQSQFCGEKISYPIVTSPVDPTDGAVNSPSAPPFVSTVDCHYHYSPLSPPYPPPPAGLFMPAPPPPPPPPFPMHYIYPPPPPPCMEGGYGVNMYDARSPEANGWASNCNYQHPWSPRW